MKAYIGNGQWAVAVGMGGTVIVDSKDRAEEVERSAAKATVTGIVLGIGIAFALLVLVATAGWC